MMKPYLIHSIIIIAISTLFVCKGQNDTIRFNTDSSIFSSKIIGWTMEIPKQWEVQTEEKLLHKINKKLNLNNVEKIDTSKKLKRLPSFLFSFEKDNRNKFTALLIPFDTSKEKIEHVFHLQRGRLYAGLAKYCIKVDSSWSREMIDKKVFIKSEITAYHDSTLVENQLSYSQIINNYCLFVLIFYDSKENKDIILNKWRNSKFEN